MNSNKIKRLMRRKGYKLTHQRLALIQLVLESQSHLSPAEIYEEVKKKHAGIGRVTVYRTLGMLQELGLICRVNLGGRKRSYLLRRPKGHHHHLVCSDCGRVVDFTGCHLSELEQRLQEGTGFEIEGHLLEFHGRCRLCREELSAKIQTT